MLRLLYRWVLRAHPPYFRQRFGDEMQSIFDHAESTGTEVGLLVDGVLSLTRQWSLRPQFWEEPTLATAGDGVPVFHTLGNFMPRTAALVYGAVLSALALNGVCWTMGYAWNHPVFVEMRMPVIVPPASWGLRSAPRPSVPAPIEPPLYTDQGRVLLIFNSPAYAASHAAAAKPSTAGQKSPTADSHSKTPTPETSPGKRGMIF